MASWAHRAQMGGPMSKTLLLADDSVVIQKLVGLSFANEDVEIVTTDNGDDAVVRIREIKPDVVLADVVMPGKSGYEVCEAIKQDPTLAHIPVLLLTGTFEAFDEARATAAGANGQITKPFEAQALVERVNEVMNASPATASEPEPPSVESATASGDYDFFDSNVTTLSAGDSSSSISPGNSSSVDQTSVIGSDDAHLFGAPGEGATDELDTRSGGLALGESVAPDDISNVPDGDATVAILPDAPPPLPPSGGDPLVGFEDDLGRDDLPGRPQVNPPTSVDLDSALDAVPSDPDATIVAGIDDTNAATSPNYDNLPEHRDEGTAASDDEFADLTMHTPSAAIDHDVASAPSPVAIGNIPSSERADATVVTNLDVSLAEPVSEATPPTPQTLDLGPSNVSPEELDFAFDVSEQVPAEELAGSLDDSFSSLMDISESQILAGPPSDPPSGSETIVDDSLASGYDVSSSDLATAPPTHEMPVKSEFAAGVDASIASGGTRQDIPEPLADPVAATLSPRVDDLELGTPVATSGAGDQVADLSPLVEQRIQETLEKVAWEAFSDLSESIVKQVIGRIEQIAWEVIPQMAETLVREEIRKMKGEKD